MNVWFAPHEHIALNKDMEIDEYNTRLPSYEKIIDNVFLVFYT